MNSIIDAQRELEFCKTWYQKEVDKATAKFKQEEADAILEGWSDVPIERRGHQYIRHTTESRKYWSKWKRI